MDGGSEEEASSFFARCEKARVPRTGHNETTSVPDKEKAPGVTAEGLSLISSV